MTEYIDKSELIQCLSISIADHRERNGLTLYSDGIADALYAVMKAKPVGHVVGTASWRFNHAMRGFCAMSSDTDRVEASYLCSNCGGASKNGREKYCPHCGFKMEVR